MTAQVDRAQGFCKDYWVVLLTQPSNLDPPIWRRTASCSYDETEGSTRVVGPSVCVLTRSG